MTRRLAIVLALFLGAGAALAQSLDTAQFPLKDDEGNLITNFALSPKLQTQLAELPGQKVVGNLAGDVTLYQFYDLNCPYCRAAATDIGRLLREDHKLKLVLVPYAVLSVKLLQGGVVEIAASHMLSPRKYLDFHEYIYANRGVIGAGQVLTAGEEVSLDRNRLAEATAKMSVVDIMRQNAEFGVHAGLIATSAFVIGGVAILVYPGLNPLERIIAAVRACGKVVC